MCLIVMYALWHNHLLIDVHQWCLHVGLHVLQSYCRGCLMHVVMEIQHYCTHRSWYDVVVRGQFHQWECGLGMFHTSRVSLTSFGKNIVPPYSFNLHTLWRTCKLRYFCPWTWYIVPLLICGEQVEDHQVYVLDTENEQLTLPYRYNEQQWHVHRVEHKSWCALIGELWLGVDSRQKTPYWQPILSLHAHIHS